MCRQICRYFYKFCSTVSVRENMQIFSSFASFEIIDSTQTSSDYILVEISAKAAKINCHIEHFDSMQSKAVGSNASIETMKLMITKQLRKQMRQFDAKLCLWPQRFLAISRSIEPVFLMVVQSIKSSLVSDCLISQPSSTAHWGLYVRFDAMKRCWQIALNSSYFFL